MKDENAKGLRNGAGVEREYEVRFPIPWLRNGVTVCIITALILISSSAFAAVETAPRISDKEIIEGLTELKAGQKVIQRDITEMKEAQIRMVGRMDSLIYAVLGSFVALIAIVIWDRRTALAPALRKSRELEEREEKLEKALREYARKEPRLAEILKEVGV